MVTCACRGQASMPLSAANTRPSHRRSAFHPQPKSPFEGRMGNGRTPRDVVGLFRLSNHVAAPCWICIPHTSEVARRPIHAATGP